MAQLGIKGSYTNCKEVIQLLEMLGGVNYYNLEGSVDSYCYYIDDSNKICSCLSAYAENIIVFTLEEFEKIYPYKVGDKVVIENYKQIFEILSVRWCAERNIIMHQTSNGWYSVNDLQPYEKEYYCQVIGNETSSNGVNTSASSINEETMEERKYADLRLDVDQDDKLATEVTIDGNKITPPKNYLIGKITKVDNGMLIEFVKKQPQYPKDYVNCCECLGHNPFINNVSGYKRDVIESLQTLITCRNAYWKIAGEQMGLGKSWEPDWREKRYIIYRNQDNIIGGCREAGFVEHHIFEFPIREMRDAFYENFKNLINECKELF